MSTDRAYWITWYDLAPDDRSGHLDWVHGRYMPLLRTRRGVLWAAHYASESNVVPLGGGAGRVKHGRPPGVPTGDRYILIVGATDAHALGDPSPAEFHARLATGDRARLAQRVEARSNLMLEEGRVLGPEYRPDIHADGPAPAIQLGSFRAGSLDEEEEMTAWYARWRLPSLRTVPGVVRVRKLVSVWGWAKHACFYEFTSVAARDAHFVHYERSSPDMEAWSKRVVQNTEHAPGSANVARRLWPPTGDASQDSGT